MNTQKGKHRFLQTTTKENYNRRKKDSSSQIRIILKKKDCEIIHGEERG
jgi:hypothetical protein